METVFVEFIVNRNAYIIIIIWADTSRVDSTTILMLSSLTGILTQLDFNKSYNNDDVFIQSNK